MDGSIEGPPEDGVQDLDLMTSTNWNTNNPQDITNNNSTLLYIAVEYVKGEFNQDHHVELASQTDSFSSFNQHVSPLDPNMSSVARYSPVYAEPANSYNPVVIHQLVSSENASTANESFVNSLNPSPPLDVIPTVLCNSDMRGVMNNQYLEIPKHQSNIINTIQPSSSLQMVPENDQEVKLLITDQATGMSYTVSTQELLVEPCLEDQHLLDTLTPDALLDTDLLALDVNSLKTELSEEIINNAIANSDPIIVSNYISSLTSSMKSTDDIFKIEPRRKQNVIEAEEQLLSKVYNIADRPVPSRARATLPESYLIITKIGEECGVFAKKTIAKQTQFGPLEGILVENHQNMLLPNKLEYYITEPDGNIVRLDVSDESTSNWMSFVRKAENYVEQNLVLSQRDCALFFTTTKDIYPKEELKVGYSVLYAEHFKLPYLKAPVLLQWPCYNCPLNFTNSEELNEHLKIHNNEYDTNQIQKTNVTTKRKPYKSKPLAVFECKMCKITFHQHQSNLLKDHLIEKHKMNEDVSIEGKFNTLIQLKCQTCDKSFNAEPAPKLPSLQHDSDDSLDEQSNNRVCPTCQNKFPAQQQVVAQHANNDVKTQKELFKCPVCYKMFPLRDRLQRHMMVHGSEESKPLQCKSCDKRFLNNSALTCHLKTHYNGKKIFECPICKMGFDHVFKLKLHVPDHCENNQYTCPHCKKIFKKYSIIRKHIRAFHCERKHDCEHCQKSFATLDKLRMHLLKHSDHREFLCADCGKQFKRKDKLKEHCKRIHCEERENNIPKSLKSNSLLGKKFTPKVEPTDFHRFIYKCNACLVGFKRRGMLVNHLAKRHPEISPDSVPELNLPILRQTRDYYCQYCEKVYKSSSKRKAHILKNHPGAALPMSNRKQGTSTENTALPNPTFSQMVGSVTTHPQSCQWCHKQYASKAKLLQHQRKKHPSEVGEKTDNGDLQHNSSTENQSIESQEKVDDIPTDMDENCLQNQFKLTFIGSNSHNVGTILKQQSDNNDLKHISNSVNPSTKPQEKVDDIAADIDENCLQNHYKITDEDILNTGIEEFNDEDLLPLSSSDDSFQQQNLNMDTSSSHLYRLLTTTNGLPPPT